MKNPWAPEENVFYNATKDNFLKFLKVSTWHYNAIKAKAGDPFFDSLILNYETGHLDYVKGYNAWQTSGGTHVGGTVTYEGLLKDLQSTKARKWDVAIQNVYPEGSGQYAALLPQHRGPFQSGSNEERTAAVKNLSLAIGTDASLATVKAEVDAFYAQLVAARAAQEGELSATSALSSDLEKLHFSTAQLQYKNLGLLMAHFYLTPHDITPYFDLLNLRDAPQVTFNITPKAGKDTNVAKRTMQPSDPLRLINDGTVDIKVYIAAEKNDAVGTVFILVNAGEEEIVTASQLGNVPASKYIKVHNDDPNIDGHCEIELL